MSVLWFWCEGWATFCWIEKPYPSSRYGQTDTHRAGTNKKLCFICAAQKTPRINCTRTGTSHKLNFLIFVPFSQAVCVSVCVCQKQLNSDGSEWRVNATVWWREMEVKRALNHSNRKVFPGLFSFDSWVPFYFSFEFFLSSIFIVAFAASRLRARHLYASVAPCDVCVCVCDDWIGCTTIIVKRLPKNRNERQSISIKCRMVLDLI